MKSFRRSNQRKLFSTEYLFCEKCAFHEWRESHERISWCVHHQLNDEIKCQKIAFALFVSMFFFELICIFTFSNEKYHCQNTIQFRIKKTIVCETLTRLHFATLTFMTKNEILNYFEFDQNFCKNCHQYKKTMEFVVRYFTEITTLYIKNGFRRKKKSVNFLKIYCDSLFNNF